jgi:O-antigen/teichoic acid export membrane protein
MIKKYYNSIKKDPLYLNSIFMILSTGVLAVFGFIFWIFVARIFSVENIGIATSLISVMTLISDITLLGLNISLIYYLPKTQQKNEMITSSNILIVVTTIIVSIIFLSELKIFSPPLLFLQRNIVYMILFILFMIGAALNIIIEVIFMTYRAASNILIKNSILSILKLALPIFLISFGAFGIFTAFSLATLLSVIASFGILYYKFNYRFVLVFNTTILKKMAYFSGGNYISGFLFQAPMLLLPIIIVNILHASAAAYYYIDTMIFNLLLVIPLASTNALLTEGSYDILTLKNHVIKATKIIFILLIPALIVILFLGNIILHFFGKNYEADAFEFLRIISVSALFIAISYIGSTILRIKHRITTLIILNLLGCIVIIGFSYLFISHGLIGVGWGWLLGQAISSLTYLLVLVNKSYFLKPFSIISDLFKNKKDMVIAKSLTKI